MELKTIAHTVVCGLVVHAMVIGAGSGMAAHPGAHGMLNTLAIAAVVLASLALVVTMWVLGSRADSISGKLGFLIFLQIVTFLLGATAAIIGLARPQGYKWNLNAPSTKNMSPVNVDPKNIDNFHQFRDSYAAAVTTMLAIGAGLELIMCFLFLRANEALGALRRADDLPGTVLWNVACGSDDSQSSPSDYEDDPEYGGQSKRKDKPTFANKASRNRRNRDHREDVEFNVPLIAKAIAEYSRSRSSSFSEDSDEASPLRGTVVSKTRTVQAAPRDAGVALDSEPAMRRGAIVPRGAFPPASAVESSAMSFDYEPTGRRAAVVTRGAPPMAESSGVSFESEPTGRRAAVVTRGAPPMVESSGVSFESEPAGRRAAVVTRGAAPMAESSGVSFESEPAGRRAAVVTRGAAPLASVIESSGVSFDSNQYGRREEVARTQVFSTQQTIDSSGVSFDPRPPPVSIPGTRRGLVTQKSPEGRRAKMVDRRPE